MGFSRIPVLLSSAYWSGTLAQVEEMAPWRSLATSLSDPALTSPDAQDPQRHNRKAAHSCIDPDAAKRLRDKKDEMASRLSRALQFRTISWDRSDPDPQHCFDPEPMLKLHQHLVQSFPNVHRNLKRTVINKYSLVYEWEGRSDSKSLKPVCFCGHLDVVPIAAPKKWRGKPFSGDVKDGEIWGRGAIDDKQAVLGMLEAVEDLLSQGYRPERSLFFCFGHDEEIGGSEGARHIANYLQSRQLQFDFLVDEGLFIIDGILPGPPLAIVCVAEKGAVTARLRAHVSGGHSSAPGKESAIGVVARAVSRLQARPLPNR